MTFPNADELKVSVEVEVEVEIEVEVEVLVGDVAVKVTKVGLGGEEQLIEEEFP